jgi:hypothetical protein
MKFLESLVILDLARYFDSIVKMIGTSAKAMTMYSLKNELKTKWIYPYVKTALKAIS